MGDLFIASDWVSAILFAGALAMTALSHKEIVAARPMVWCALLLIILRWGWWGMITEQPWPIRAGVGAIIGAFILAAIPAAFHWIRDRSTGQSRSNESQIPSPSLGSLVFQNGVFQVERKVSTKQTNVTMLVQLRNENGFLLKFHARLEGQVGGASGQPIEFDGFIPANQTNTLTFTRMDGVAVNETAKFGDAVLYGELHYDVSYWNANGNRLPSRRTARTCIFRYFGPLAPPGKFEPGTVKRSVTPVTVGFKDEVEE